MPRRNRPYPRDDHHRLYGFGMMNVLHTMLVALLSLVSAAMCAGTWGTESF
jgi:hypothetical protein